MAVPWTWTPLPEGSSFSSVSPKTILNEIKTNVDTTKTAANTNSYSMRTSWSTATKKPITSVEYLHEAMEDIAELKSTTCSSYNSTRNNPVNADYGHCAGHNSSVNTSNDEDYFAAYQDSKFICNQDYSTIYDTKENRVYYGNSV